MGRPLAITPETAAIVEAQRVPGQTIAQWHRRCCAAGVKIARHTLEAYDQRAASAAPDAVAQARPEAPVAAAIVADAEAAAEGDDLAELRRMQRVVRAAARAREPYLDGSDQIVKAYGNLIGLQGRIAKSIAELTPRPEADRYKPIEAEALTALVARAEASARAEDAAARRGRAYDALIESGRLVAAD